MVFTSLHQMELLIQQLDTDANQSPPTIIKKQKKFSHRKQL